MGAGQDSQLETAATRSVERVTKLYEPAECQTCGWVLDPGDLAVSYRGEIFCRAACARKALGRESS